MSWHRSPKEIVKTRFRRRARNGVLIHTYELSVEESGWWRVYPLCRKVQGWVYPSEPSGWRNWARFGRRLGGRNCDTCVKTGVNHPAEESVLT